MQKSSLRYFTSSLIICLGVAGLLSPLPATAKEDTVHLTFRKGAASSRQTFTYTVKKGDHLLNIVKNITGLTKNRYSVIKRYNPHLKNLNLIHPGQKLVLPVSAKRSVSQVGGSGVPAAAEPTSARGVLQSGTTLPSASRLALMQGILKRMNGSMMTSGRYVIPIPELGQITIDCAMIPIIEFDDGSVVLMDYRGQLPDNIKSLIRKYWKTHTVVRTDAARGALITLSAAVNASTAYTMSKAAGPLTLGQKPVCRLPVDWMISGKPASARTTYRHALVTLKTEEERLPRAVLAYLERHGLPVTEIINDSVLPPWRDTPADKSFTVLSRLDPTSVKDLIIDLLTRTGLSPLADTTVPVFDSKTDGFDLSVTANIEVRRDKERVLFTTKRLPKQFTDILIAKGAEIVFLPTESPVQAIEKVLTALRIPYSTVPYVFPVSTKTALEETNITFPTIRIAVQKGRPLYLIDFDMDGDIFSLLHDKMGFNIIRY